MNKAILLDKDKVARLEPSEADGSNRSWISPFDVPVTIEMLSDEAFREIRSIRFGYPGGEASSVRRVLQAGPVANPPVHIVCGRLSGKILEMTFAEPIPLAALPLLSERLKSLAKQTTAIATRFNYQMIAQILERWPSIADPAS